MYPYMRGKYILPLFDLKPSIVLEKVLNEDIKKSLKYFESHFLKSGHFIVGDKITIADISAYCELS